MRRRLPAAKIVQGVRGPTRPAISRAVVATATASRATGPPKAVAGKATAAPQGGGQTVAVNVEVEMTKTETVAVCQADRPLLVVFRGVYFLFVQLNAPFLAFLLDGLFVGFALSA